MPRIVPRGLLLELDQNTYATRPQRSRDSVATPSTFSLVPRMVRLSTTEGPHRHSPANSCVVGALFVSQRH